MQRDRTYQRGIKIEQARYNKHKERLLALAKKGNFRAFKELHNKFWSRDPVDLGLAWEAFKKQHSIPTKVEG